MDNCEAVAMGVCLESLSAYAVVWAKLTTAQIPGWKQLQWEKKYRHLGEQVANHGSYPAEGWKLIQSSEQDD
jgi:hypothetical protein